MRKDWGRRRGGGIAIAVVAVLAGAGVAGCAATTTATVTQTTSAAVTQPTSTAPASTPSTPSDSTPTDSAPTPAPSQVFHGSGQKDLGTIVVPTDSTISWNCPSCGGTNFIINNAHADDNAIPTNGLDLTHGVDPIPAGTYHTVVVDTTGGPWTVAIGTAAPAPSGPPGSGSAPQAGSWQCDPNISVSGGADCRFAENTFYEYWTHHGATTFSVYSPTDQSSLTVNCDSSNGISCTTHGGGTVEFPQSAIDAYTQGQADSYARSHNVGP